MGTFFEKVAQILCNGEKREYTSTKKKNLTIYESQKKAIDQIMGSLETEKEKPNLKEENKRIYTIDENPKLTDSMNFSADVYYEKGKEIIAIELKTVHPNAGEIKSEKRKILEGKAALFKKNRPKDIKFYIGFPFDPNINPNGKEKSETSYDKNRFFQSIINMEKYFAHDEVLIAGELWDFLSGQQNTMEEIIKIIQTISTPDFHCEFEWLRENSQQRTSQKYIDRLQKWNLFSELELVNQDEILIQKMKEKKSIKQTYNAEIFNKDGNYNSHRYDLLKRMLKG